MRTLVKMMGIATLVAASALPFTAGSASAVPIAGTTSFLSTGASGQISLTKLLSTFSFALSVGASSTQNLVTITPDPPQRNPNLQFHRERDDHIHRAGNRKPSQFWDGNVPRSGQLN